VSTGLERVTVRDVAKLAGVSTATVTRTLQNGELVLPATQKRVIDAVEALGYRPNPMARDLRQGGPAAAVGLAISSFTNAFQTGVAAGAERELRRAGLQLLIGSSDLNPAHEPELVRAMVDRRVSVLMVMPDSDARDHLQPDRLFGTPAVFVGRPAEGVLADVVMTDDDRAVQEATEALIDLGHRRIAALAGDRSSFRTKQRLSGYRTALSRRGIPEATELVVTELLTSESAATAAGQLLDGADPPTALLAMNLGISNGVLLDRILNQRQNAFIALDESELSVGLGISAVARDPEDLGRTAAQLAISRIREPDRDVLTVLRPSFLVRRGSGEIRPLKS